MKLKKLLITLSAGAMLLTLSGCQWAAKNVGGSYTVELEPGQKLVNATWKEDQLWYLTENMPEDYTPKTYKFQEDSTMNVLEGTVTIVETK